MILVSGAVACSPADHDIIHLPWPQTGLPFLTFFQGLCIFLSLYVLLLPSFVCLFSLLFSQKNKQRVLLPSWLLDVFCYIGSAQLHPQLILVKRSIVIPFSRKTENSSL